jgi:hypothetical protein
MITFETITTACGTYRRGVLAGCVLLPHDDEQAQRSYIPFIELDRSARGYPWGCRSATGSSSIG